MMFDYFPRRWHNRKSPFEGGAPTKEGRGMFVRLSENLFFRPQEHPPAPPRLRCASLSPFEGGIAR